MPRKSAADGEVTAFVFAPTLWPIISKVGMALHAIWRLDGGMVLIRANLFHLLIQR